MKTNIKRLFYRFKQFTYGLLKYSYLTEKYFFTGFYLFVTK